MLAYLAYKQGKKAYVRYQEKHYYDEYNRPCQNPLDPNAPRRLPPPFVSTTTVEEVSSPSGEIKTAVSTEEKAFVPARAAISAPPSRSQTPTPPQPRRKSHTPLAPQQRTVTMTTTKTTATQLATASEKPAPPPKPLALQAPPRPPKPASLHSEPVTAIAGAERRNTVPDLSSRAAAAASPILPPRQQLLLSDSSVASANTSRRASPHPPLPPRRHEIMPEEVVELGIRRSNSVGHAPTQKQRMDL